MPNHTGCIGGGSLKEQIHPHSVLIPTAETATFTEDGTDRKGYNSLLFIVTVDETGGAGTYTPSIAHGTVAGTLVAATTAELGGSDTPVAISADGMSSIYVDCRNMSRYVGLIMTAASSPQMTIAIIAILGAQTEYLPTA
jgi:hypothetical protein